MTRRRRPYWGYDHELPVVPGEDCAIDPGTGEPVGNQISGRQLLPATGSFPAAYRDALFFGDQLAQLHVGDAARGRRGARSAGR